MNNMNKHDFYKEIMSRYTFDEEKIRRNAKRASSPSFLASSSRWLPLTTAAAVFVAVFGGYMLFSPSTNGKIAPEVTGAYSSYEERINDITVFEELLTKTPIEDNVYISFAKPLTYKEFESVLELVVSDTGSIETKALWNGEFVSSDAAYDANVFYSGAKVFAEVDGSLYTALSQRPEFLAVEREGKVNESNFEPLIKTPTYDDVVSQPANTTAPPQTTAAPSPQDPPMTVLLADPDVDEFTEPTEPDDNTEPNDEPTEDVMAEVETLEISVENAKTAEFIDENTIVILTNEQILIYEIDQIDYQPAAYDYEVDGVTENVDEYEYSLVSSFDAISPKIIFTDPRSGTLLITALDSFGRQTELFIIKPEAQNITRLDTNIVTGAYNTEINYGFYNNGEIILKAQSSDEQFIYTASEADGYAFERRAQSPYKLVILSQGDDRFIYAEQFEDGGFEINVVYKSGEGESFDLELGPETKFERSPDAKNFAIITEAHTHIYNAETGELTTLSDVSQIKFDAEKPTFSSTYRVYELNPEAVSIEVIS